MGFDTFQEAREEFGTNDFYGIWLFPDGKFLDCRSDADHREASNNPYDWCAKGAISIRKNARGELYLRVAEDYGYSCPVKRKLEELSENVTDLVIAFFDENSDYVREVRAKGMDDVKNAMLELIDPISYYYLMEQMENGYETY